MSDNAPLTQRDVESLRTTLHKLDQTITAFPDKVAETYARKDVIDLRFAAVESTVASHSGWLLWTQRIVIGAVIAALLALVIVGR